VTTNSQMAEHKWQGNYCARCKCYRWKDFPLVCKPSAADATDFEKRLQHELGSGGFDHLDRKFKAKGGAAS
jgi:hypothetical protein